MNQKEVAKQEATKWTVNKLLPVLLLFGAALQVGGIAAFRQIASSLSPATTAVLLWLTLETVCIETTFLIYLRRKLRKELKPRFGVLWSSDQNPYCPACSKPLGRFGNLRTGGGNSRRGFWCIQCRQVISMADDTGNILELTEVRQLL